MSLMYRRFTQTELKQLEAWERKTRSTQQFSFAFVPFICAVVGKSHTIGCPALSQAHRAPTRLDRSRP
jgi:hypothetical protein